MDCAKSRAEVQGFERELALLHGRAADPLVGGAPPQLKRCPRERSMNAAQTLATVATMPMASMKAN